MVLHRFLQERRGAVAPMFALAIIPIFGLIGMAVDYSRGNSARTAMQARNICPRRWTNCGR